MKKIMAYVRTYMAEKVLDALLECGIRGVSVFQGKGFAQHAKETPQSCFDTAIEDGFVGVTKLESVCSDAEVSAIIRVIQKNAHTGRAGTAKYLFLKWSRRTISGPATAADRFAEGLRNT